MKKIFLVCLLIFITFWAWVQESEVFAPFVSRLKASAENNSIKLTWEDSKDVSGRNIIYRYFEEINNSNLNNADKLAEIPTGTESFIDYPKDNSDYFYAVLIRDNNGEFFNYIIPFRNSTSKAARIETIATEEDLSTSISELAAVYESDLINITFKSSNPTRSVLIYRHTDPINSSERLLEAQLVAELPSGTNSYKDSPIPGVPIYYGVFDAGMLMINKFVFNAGDNITFQPVEIPISAGAFGVNSTLSRSQPLPLLLINSYVGDNKALTDSLNLTIPEKKSLSKDTEAVLAKIISNIPIIEAREMAPEVLAIDKALNTRGEQYSLSLILSEYFQKKQWDETESEIKRFMRTHHSAEIEVRAHFYLGQTYYFQKRYEDAFLEFLLVKDDFYSQTDKWLNAIFKKLNSIS